MWGGISGRGQQSCHLAPEVCVQTEQSFVMIGKQDISILCLTTDPIHQGHEKRKKSVTSARSPRNTSTQLRDRKVWEAVTSRCLGNGRSDTSCKQYGGVSAWYKQFSVSASYKQYVSDECTSRQKRNMLSLLHAACLKLLVFFFSFGRCPNQIFVLTSHVPYPYYVCRSIAAIYILF